MSGTPDPLEKQPLPPWRMRLHEVIFEAETLRGKAFDLALLVTILLSVVVVMLESVEEYREKWGTLLLTIEWIFTILFTVEYALRLICVVRPWRYATSFFGIVDLLAIIPTYLSIVVAGSQALIVVRTLRLVRVFRVLELSTYAAETQALYRALRRTQAKITVFLLCVLSMVMIVGSAMYLIENQEPDTQFTSIPRSVYWAIVTMTTVGYGDIAPQTALGQAVAALAMIIGYSVIIVPMGIFSVEVVAARQEKVLTRSCPSCALEGHDVDAFYCKRCGARI